MLKVSYGQATNAGRVRTNNEDAMGCYVPVAQDELNEQGCLFAVADGVGGLEMGEIASATAISTLIDEYALAASENHPTRLLPRLIQAANKAVHQYTLHPGRPQSQMATTIVACALRFDQAAISHVGDSRCYLIRDGQAQVLTQDHTWVNEQKKLGFITEEEARESSFRSVLTRSLGTEPNITPSNTHLTIRPGDAFVLCSDGLHAEMSDEQIARIVTQTICPQKAADDLLAQALEIDGSDNTTVQVVRVHSIARMVSYRGRSYPQSG